jgi:EmrB/QacA subfamily drug resistance transporter
MQAADGYYRILGRIDDVINVAGHRLGTKEIESAAMIVPEVAEAAVVPVADQIKGRMPDVFIFGSGMCGAAQNLDLLVGFRALQAIGAALMQANSITIVVVAAGRRRRGWAIGLQASAQAIGLSVGPALGGLLIHALSWRWVFWINVPIGLVGAGIGWLVLPRMRVYPDDRRFDWGGVVLLAPTLTAFVLAINQGHMWGIQSPAFISCILVVFLLLPLLFWWEGRQRSPLLDFALLRRRVFWAGNLAGLLSYATLFGIFFLMPFVFERAFGESALSAGLQLMVIPVALGIMSPASGALYDRLDSRPLTVAGMALVLCACIWLAIEMGTEAPGTLPVTAALALFGIGQGLFTSPNNSAVMASPPEEEIGQAGGVLNVTRSFGTSIGVAASAALFSWRLRETGSLSTMSASPDELVSAARYVLAMFAAFALIAFALSWMHPLGGTRSRNARELAVT